MTSCECTSPPQVIAATYSTEDYKVYTAVADSDNNELWSATNRSQDDPVPGSAASRPYPYIWYTYISKTAPLR